MPLTVQNTRECTVGAVQFMVVRIAADGLHLDALHVDVIVQHGFCRQVALVDYAGKPAQSIGILQVVESLFIHLALALVLSAVDAVSVLVILMGCHYRLSLGVGIAHVTAGCTVTVEVAGAIYLPALAVQCGIFVFFQLLVECYLALVTVEQEAQLAGLELSFSCLGAVAVAE